MARTKPTGNDSGDGQPSPAPTPDTAPGRTRAKGRSEGYTVVARRYRPQRFEDVVGQDHVVQSLRNAIRMDRVAQAYLFSGTRGVGKTSMARIFAKALNCVHGPTETPCNSCDLCQSIAVGQDVDVIEIDGASNNGVEAVRELRQNAGLRPSRSRFKIYYIDEVHMLSVAAFNALLKTLEEPPGHVKFIFATTEPNKIPITVLSRCQRFDFAGIAPNQIVDVLAGICDREGVTADRDALHTVARRAGGSMRDAQSLLEQLLSSADGGLTADRVQQLLGIAGDDRVLDLLDALADRDPGRSLSILDAAISDGAQAPEVLGSAIEFLRDVMIAAAGAGVPFLAALPAQAPRLQSLADRWPLDTILAAQQILAETRGRLRGSPHTRLLVELALCRVARLEDMAELGDLVARLSGLERGGPPPVPSASTAKKKSVAPENGRTSPVTAPPAGSDGTSTAEPSPVVASTRPSSAKASPLEEAQRAWVAAVDQLGATNLGQIKPVAVPESGVVVVEVPGSYNWVVDKYEKPELKSRIESRLSEALGHPVTVRFDRASPPPEAPRSAPSGPGPHEIVLDDPLARQLIERFDAQLRRIESGTGAESEPNPSPGG